MRKDWSHLEKYRRCDHSLWSSSPGDTFGCFVIPHPEGSMVCIASDGDEEIPWEHVSLRMDTRLGQRCPTWAEMCQAKDLFWPEDEAVAAA